MRKTLATRYLPLQAAALAAASAVAWGTLGAGPDTRSIVLAVDAVSGPGFTAKGIRVELAGADLGRARFRLGELQAFDRRWEGIVITCAAFRLDRSLIACDRGQLDGKVPLALAFTYDLARGETTLILSPDKTERWELRWSGDAQRRAALIIANGSLARVHDFLPALPVKLSAGTVSGTLRAALGAAPRIEGEMTLQALAFSDAAGLHAGESIEGRVVLNAEARKEIWGWNIEVTWPRGEVFWNPVYSKAGYRVTATGTLDATTATVERATLTADDVGEVHASASIDRASRAIRDARVETGVLPLASLYARFLKPLASDTAFGELRVAGALQARAAWQAGRLAEATVELDDASLEDQRGRFALFGLYAELPWRRAAPTEGRIGMSGAEFQRLPIGAMGAVVEINPDEVRLAHVAIPILSGLLQLNDFRLRRVNQDIAWEVGGALSPVPLDLLLGHFGLPAMEGNISGEIPRVRYGQSVLQIDGGLLIRVFDGTVRVADLRMESPLGLAPRLHATLDAHNLDLGLVTRTFAFGNITGRVDASVHGLALSNWQPVRFDARIESSPGDYPRRISQTAVNSISALGGSGAVTAIQRSALRFFETFGYSKLGLSCRLQEGVCRMSGIEEVPGGYVIVKGGGIPAITVLGYNRDVGWNELITRLKRVLDENVKPTIQ